MAVYDLTQRQGLSDRATSLGGGQHLRLAPRIPNKGVPRVASCPKNKGSLQLPSGRGPGRQYRTPVRATWTSRLKRSNAATCADRCRRGPNLLRTPPGPRLRVVSKVCVSHPDLRPKEVRCCHVHIHYRPLPLA
jgi:hypothetical protein